MTRIALALCALLLLAQPCSAREGWLTVPKEALKQAKERKVPVLVEFAGSDWCAWCKKLEEEVLSRGTFQGFAKEVVLLELDFPKQTPQPKEVEARNREWAKRYEVQRFPTVLLIDHEGSEIGRMGYEQGGADSYVAKLRALLKEGFDAKTGKAKPKPKPTWTTSWQEAVAESKASGKVILADFTGSDWCGWCKRLHAEVFNTREFVAWAKERVILLELDFPSRKKQPDELKTQNEELQKRYGIEGFPTVLLLDAEGKILGRSGYLPGGPKAWIKNAVELVPALGKARARDSKE
ncbi:MAG TPA: hypothetical protein DEA08_19125 [Planctomycetes bacterium]|nr:hypothetical protein [Planctomycetota bacterium]|tara:strand:- start:1764 stop:2645 length:882 start_codon:yes stop_codon:yes gene_type:complete